MEAESGMIENKIKEIGMGDGCNQDLEKMAFQEGSGVSLLTVWFISITWEHIRTVESLLLTPDLQNQILRRCFSSGEIEKLHCSRAQ